MVSSVTSSVPQYYSYLNQLQGVQATSQPAATSPVAVTPATSTDTSQNNTASSSDSSAVSSLLGGGTGGFSSAILSLLQDSGNGSFDPVSSLLGGTSTNNQFTPVLTSLYTSASAAVVTKAKDNVAATEAGSTGADTGANLINSLLQSQSDASVAYNATTVQAVQNVVASNSYQVDGITPIVV